MAGLGRDFSPIGPHSGYFSCQFLLRKRMNGHVSTRGLKYLTPDLSFRPSFPTGREIGNWATFIYFHAI